MASSASVETIYLVLKDLKSLENSGDDNFFNYWNYSVVFIITVNFQLVVLKVFHNSACSSLIKSAYIFFI